MTRTKKLISYRCCWLIKSFNTNKKLKWYLVKSILSTMTSQEYNKTMISWFRSMSNCKRNILCLDKNWISKRIFMKPPLKSDSIKWSSLRKNALLLEKEYRNSMILKTMQELSGNKLPRTKRSSKENSIKKRMRICLESGL